MDAGRANPQVYMHLNSQQGSVENGCLHALHSFICGGMSSQSFTFSKGLLQDINFFSLRKVNLSESMEVSAWWNDQI